MIIKLECNGKLKNEQNRKGDGGGGENYKTNRALTIPSLHRLVRDSSDRRLDGVTFNKLGNATNRFREPTEDRNNDTDSNESNEEESLIDLLLFLLLLLVHGGVHSP